MNMWHNWGQWGSFSWNFMETNEKEILSFQKDWSHKCVFEDITGHLCHHLGKNLAEKTKPIMRKNSQEVEEGYWLQQWSHDILWISHEHKPVNSQRGSTMCNLKSADWHRKPGNAGDLQGLQAQVLPCTSDWKMELRLRNSLALVFQMSLWSLFHWTHVPGSSEPLCLIQPGPSAWTVFLPRLHLANCSSTFKRNGGSAVWSLPCPWPVNWSPLSSCHLRTLTTLPRQPCKLLHTICLLRGPWALWGKAPWMVHLWSPRACMCSILMRGKREVIKNWEAVEGEKKIHEY